MYTTPSLYGYVLDLIPRRRKRRNAASNDPQHSFVQMSSRLAIVGILRSIVSSVPYPV
ncbi:hypothetical protein CY34DRAFT_807586 [Suillus luteus UH-Slu-Lm8-n1]|uniref:Uncharacterized protein n=1 Tax=Suillus luteus UH-Slu-Lm8-n1 TaxID=930992 RepID=A0A0D0B0G7_9AGAM|nr:hypothetical protein CY34DRAFT_807586 [Suillus luteus UH-Slu-Lm8-n1]